MKYTNKAQQMEIVALDDLISKDHIYRKFLKIFDFIKLNKHLNKHLEKHCVSKKAIQKIRLLYTKAMDY